MAVGVTVGLGVGVAVDVGVEVALGLGVGVAVDVAVEVAVGLGVAVTVEVAVEVAVKIGVAVAVDVAVESTMNIGAPTSIGVGDKVPVMVKKVVGGTPAANEAASTPCRRATERTRKRAVTPQRSPGFSRRRGSEDVRIGNTCRHIRILKAPRCPFTSLPFVKF